MSKFDIQNHKRDDAFTTCVYGQACTVSVASDEYGHHSQAVSLWLTACLRDHENLVLKRYVVCCISESVQHYCHTLVELTFRLHSMIVVNLYGA